MNHRTLNKENSMHLMNVVSMVMAWGVTSYYFEHANTVDFVGSLGNWLLFPAQITDDFFKLFSTIKILGHPTRMFLTLWLFYMLPIIRFYPLLMIQNHQVSDLKKWYDMKNS